LYKPNDANGEEIDQWFEFKSRADFLQSYLDFYRNLPTLKSAIINGCCAKFKVLYEDKEYELKHTHQEEFEDEKGNKKGVNNVILTDMAVKLVLQEKKLKNTKSFEDVYQIVKSAKVPGFRFMIPLYVYRLILVLHLVTYIYMLVLVKELNLLKKKVCFQMVHLSKQHYL